MISFNCRSCGAPQSAENKELAEIVVCYNCGQFAAQKPAPPKSVRRDVPVREPELPPVVSGPPSGVVEPVTASEPRHGVGVAFGVIFGFVAAVIVILGAIAGYKLLSKKGPELAEQPAAPSTHQAPLTKPAPP